MNDGLLVVGMHRSGTSALAGVAHMRGAALNRSLMESRPGDNERGFWESKEIARLHDDLLRALGTSWDETIPLSDGWWRRHEAEPVRGALLRLLREDFAEAPLWLVKDPRLCRLLPLWIEIAKELRCRVGCALILRNPAEVVDSLAARSGLSPGFGYLLWLDHVLSAERLSRGLPRCFVSYAELLGDWRATTERIARELDLRWPVEAADAASRIDAFLSADLRHHELDAHAATGDLELSEWIGAAWAALQRLAAGDEQGEALEALDGIAREVAAGERLFGRALAAGRGERALLRTRIDELEREVLRLGRELRFSQREVEQKAEQLEGASAVYEQALRVKEEELAQAARTLDAAIERKDAQIGATNEYLQLRTGELDRLRQELDERGKELEQLRAELQRLRAAPPRPAGS